LPKGEAAGSIAYPQAVVTLREIAAWREAALSLKGSGQFNLIKVDSKYIDNFCNLLHRGSDYKGEVAIYQRPICNPADSD
jgi:hypothetical protein